MAKQLAVCAPSEVTAQPSLLTPQSTAPQCSLKALIRLVDGLHMEAIGWSADEEPYLDSGGTMAISAIVCRQ